MPKIHFDIKIWPKWISWAKFLGVSIKSSFSWWLTKSKGITSLISFIIYYFFVFGFTTSLNFELGAIHQVLRLQTIWKNQSGKSPICLTQIGHIHFRPILSLLIANLDPHSSAHTLQLDWVCPPRWKLTPI